MMQRQPFRETFYDFTHAVGKAIALIVCAVVVLYVLALSSFGRSVICHFQGGSYIADSCLK